MLARLDEIDGVAASRVDWTGRRILLELAPGAPAGRAVARAKAVLGGRARRLPAGEEAEQVASFRGGDPWMRAGESARLSRREAEVLAARFAEEVAREAGLDAAGAERIGALLREEVTAAFEEAHEAGGEVRRLGERLPASLERSAAKLAGSFPEEQARRIREALERRLVRD